MAAAGQKVLISGASFAGLATAYWMVRLGYAVTIVELARALKKGGTPVNIREGVIDVVRRMGLLERIAAQSLKDRPMQCLGEDGQRVATMFAEEHHDGAEAYEIERDDLLQMMFDAVKDDVEVLWSDSIAAMQQSAEEVSVTLTSGTTGTYALVLGCDGTHSAVRRMCFGEESAYLFFMQNYFGLSIVNELLIEEDTQQMFNIPGRTVMLNAYHGKTDIAFCFSSDAPVAYDRRNREEQKQRVRERFAGVGWRIPELLEALAGCDNFYFDQVCQIRMDSWVNGRVALVGDAGYCPSPAAGMGGSMAILGAAALGDAMRNHPGDPAAGFAEYDTSFRPIAEQIQSDAMAGMEMVMPRSVEAIEQRNAQWNAA